MFVESVSPGVLSLTTCAIHKISLLLTNVTFNQAVSYPELLPCRGGVGDHKHNIDHKFDIMMIHVHLSSIVSKIGVSKMYSSRVAFKVFMTWTSCQCC